MEIAEKINAVHTGSVWKGKNGYWYTYLVHPKKGRKLTRKRSLEDLQDAVNLFHREVKQDPTFFSAYHEWICEKEEYREVGQSSLTRYRSDFRRFFKKDSHFCKIPLRDLTGAELERFIKTTIRDEGLTAKTYAGMRTLLIGVLKYAKREGYTDFSVGTFFKDLSLPRNIFQRKVRRREKEVFTIEEMRILVSHLENRRGKKDLAILLQLYSGLRVGELTALKAEDNVAKNQLFVCRTEYNHLDKKTGKRTTTVREHTKTEDGTRYVVIPQRAQDILDELKGQATSEGYIFAEQGKRVTSRQVNYHLAKCCGEVGIVPKSTHKLRRSYISMILLDNADDAFVQSQVGHKQISTTRGYYHYDILPNEEKVRAVEQALRHISGAERG